LDVIIVLAFSYRLAMKREKEFHNRVFDSIDSLEDHLEKALYDMEHDHDRIRSIVAWPWIINALMN
jgi:hypothetical protein